MESATSFEHIIDLGTEHIEWAIASRENFRTLLERAAAVSQPEDGGPKLLMACAALVRAPWLDGELRVEIEGDEHHTRLSLLIDAGFRERIFPVVTLNVPLDEFARATRLVPRLIVPLAVQERRGALILKPKHETRPSARPTTRMQAVDGDVHTRPTRVRMAAVRLEDLPEARREDHADIDGEWDDEK